METTMDLKREFRIVADFPERRAINFIDITPILQDPKLLKHAVDALCDMASKYDFDLVIAPESRGFILGTPVCYLMNKGFCFP